MKNQAELSRTLCQLEDYAVALGVQMRAEREQAYPLWLKLREVESTMHALRWVLGREGVLLTTQEGEQCPAP